MLKQKLTKGIAFAATVALLAGCAPAVDPTVAGTAKPGDTTTTTTTTTTTPVASASATPAPVVSATAAPVVNSSTIPQDTTGTTSDIKEKATFNGKVFDTSGVPVDDATVTAKSVDPAVAWTGEPQKTQSGAYVFRNAPVGARLEITARKDGWTTRLRTEVLKSNLIGDPLANVFDFGSGNGSSGTDPNNLYSIQDEPEVTMLKINGKTASDSDGASTKNPNPRKPDGLTPNMTGLSSDSLTVEMTFSEPVRRDDVENYFRIASQAVVGIRSTNFTIDRNLINNGFTWAADDSSVTFKTSKAVLSNRTGDEARYLVDFTNAFRDKTDKASKTQRYFRFSPSKINDFHVFSVKNQDADPFITNVQAIDGGSSNDTVKVTFSKAMDVINQTVPQALLADPTNATTANDPTLQLFAYNTSNGAAANNATILGFTEKATGKFEAVYSIARLTSGDLQTAVGNKSGAALWTKALGGTNITTAITKSVSLAKVDGNVITIEFNSQAFDKDDRVILSAGQTVDGRYDDKVNNVVVNSLRSSLLANGGDFYKITDPAGRPLDSGNSSTSANIDINNSQRVATAN